MKKSVFIFFSLLFSPSAIHAQTWEFVGLDSLLIFHLYVEGDTMYAGTLDRNNNPNLNSGLYYSSDGGSNWTQLDSSLGEGAILGLERDINNTMYIIKCPCQAGNVGTLYKTTNNGQSWEPFNNISNNRIRWVGISPFNTNDIYAIDGGIINNLYRSTDAGENWKVIGSFPADSHGNRVAIALDLLHDSTLYAGVSTSLLGEFFYKSTDKGDNWFFVSTPPAVALEIYTDYFIPDRIYLMSKYVSNNSGLNWFEADSGSNMNGYYLSFYQDRQTSKLLYKLRTDGLYESRNDTFYWNRLEDSENLPLELPTEIRNFKNIAIDKISRKIYLGTSNGIYRKSVLTNILKEENLGIEEFILEQNFPNPFNPRTTINYHMEASAYVTLKVYDLLGNELAVLVDKDQQAGDYAVEFNASRLPSEIYFYKLQAGSFVETKKMVLLK